MKNIIIAIGFLVFLLLAFVNEPIDDAVDAFAGVTTVTFDPAIDGTGGASTLYGDDDEHDEEDDEEEEDDD